MYNLTEDNILNMVLDELVEIRGYDEDDEDSNEDAYNAIELIDKYGLADGATSVPATFVHSSLSVTV